METLEQPVITLEYPATWAAEYRKTGNVAAWLEQHLDLFPPHILERRGTLSSRLGTLDLFAQYALQFLLRSRQGIDSRSWYKLASSPRAQNRQYIDDCWEKMQRYMKRDFLALQNAIVNADLPLFAGEPDLFCWKPTDGTWFFAEAKGKDRVQPKQRKWTSVYRQTLPTAPKVRLYRLVESRQASQR
ncbi:MAG: VRR-NUC domain-containing protein [Polyangia bacterium]